MCQEHPAAIQFGVPRSEPETGRVGGDTPCGNTYRHLPRSWQYYKRIRKLKLHLSPLFLYSYTSFQLANLYIPRCGRWASRSLHDRFFPASRDRKSPEFRLRKIAGAAADDPRLSLPVEENADGRADRIAIRFCALQIKSNAAGVRLLVVEVQIRRTVVRCQEDVEVVVAVEIAGSEVVTNLGR